VRVGGELFFVVGVEWGVFGQRFVGGLVWGAEQVDGVGDQPGVVVGGNGVVGVGVGEVFGG
jgi:hypothetical protein